MKLFKNLKRLGGRRRPLDGGSATPVSKVARSHHKTISSALSSTTETSESSSPQTWRVGNFLSTPPSEEEWWLEEAGFQDDDENHGLECSIYSDPSTLGTVQNRLFHNRGYDAWEQARSEWRKETVGVKAPRPPPVRSLDEVVKGLTQGTRQYELPGRMTLTDVIGVYSSVWDVDTEPW